MNSWWMVCARHETPPGKADQFDWLMVSAPSAVDAFALAQPKVRVPAPCGVWVYQLADVPAGDAPVAVSTMQVHEQRPAPALVTLIEQRPAAPAPPKRRGRKA